MNLLFVWSFCENWSVRGNFTIVKSGSIKIRDVQSHLTLVRSEKREWKILTLFRDSPKVFHALWNKNARSKWNFYFYFDVIDPWLSSKRVTLLRKSIFKLKGNINKIWWRTMNKKLLLSKLLNWFVNLFDVWFMDFN